MIRRAKGRKSEINYSILETSDCLLTLVKSRLALGSPGCSFVRDHAENGPIQRKMVVDCPLVITAKVKPYFSAGKSLMNLVNLHLNAIPNFFFLCSGLVFFILLLVWFLILLGFLLLHLPRLLKLLLLVNLRANFFSSILIDVQDEVLSWLVWFEDPVLHVFVLVGPDRAAAEAAIEAVGCRSHVEEELDVEKQDNDWED